MTFKVVMRRSASLTVTWHAVAAVAAACHVCPMRHHLEACHLHALHSPYSVSSTMLTINLTITSVRACPIL